MFDYYVTLVEDCCAAYEPRLHDNILENIRRNFGLVASSEEVIASWSERGRKKVVGLDS